MSLWEFTKLLWPTMLLGTGIMLALMTPAFIITSKWFNNKYETPKVTGQNKDQ